MIKKSFLKNVTNYKPLINKKKQFLQDNLYKTVKCFYFARLTNTNSNFFVNI